MNRTRWIIFAAICVAVLGTLAFMGNPSNASFEGNPAEVVKDDNVYGNPEAEVVLIEYGDFQCPGCGALYPVLKDVKQEYEDKIAVVYRYLPLTNIHPNAKAAAAAAAAAAEQDKFWEMHDLLYDRQSEWSRASASQRSAYFENYAQQLGLNMQQYREDVTSGAVTERVGRGLAAARKAGLQLSTPILVLDGERLELSSIQSDGRYDAEKLRGVLNQALQAAGVEPPQANTGNKTQNEPQNRNRSNQ